jgi:hypothetical protein
MNAPKIEVSAAYPAQKSDWGNAVVLENKTDSHLYFSITPNDATSVQIIFPVYPTAIKSKAITDNDSWGRESCRMTVLQQAGTDDIAIEKTSRNNIYQFDITIAPDIKDAIIIQLDIKTIDAAEAICQVNYYDDEGQQELPEADWLKINIEEKPKQPVIEAFTTNRAVLKQAVTGETDFVLSWKVLDAKKIRIEQDGATIDNPDVASNNLPVSNLKHDSTYKLIATNGTLNAEKAITIQYLKTTGVYTVESFNENKLVNLINGGDKIYALVKNDDNSDIIMWQTSDGINWDKSDAGSFKSNALPVPLEFAGSSGVFYDNKIYLIGGSRFDFDFKSNGIWFFDFNDKNKGWQAGTEPSFTSRMGHALVVYKPALPQKPAIWLLGGLGPQGTFDDIHIFEGGAWREQNFKMHHALCMHNIIISGNNIEVYGGFGDNPATLDQKIKDAVFLDITSINKEWKAFPWIANSKSGSIVNNNQLSCNVGLIKDNRFFFTIFKGNDLEYGVYKLNEGRELVKQPVTNQVTIDKYFTSTQIITFNNLICFCAVLDDGVFESRKLCYFVTIP